MVLNEAGRACAIDLQNENAKAADIDRGYSPIAEVTIYFAGARREMRLVMKILIVGSGAIGEMHAQVIGAAGGHSLAFCDSSRESAQRLANAFGADEIYADYTEAIRKSCAQAVIVCTPNFLHAPVTIEALGAGCDVLCEKPMASTLQQAAAMQKAA